MIQLALKKPLNQLWIVEDQWPCKKDKGSDIVRNLPDLPCFHASWNAELEIVCRWKQILYDIKAIYHDSLIECISSASERACIALLLVVI